MFRFVTFASLFVLFFLTAAFQSGLWNGTHVEISVFLPPEQVREEFGDSDAGNYLQAALGLRDRGPWGIDGNRWIFNVWPPGMVTLNLFLLLAESFFRIPYVLGLVVANGLVVSSAVTLVSTRIFVKNHALAIVFPMAFASSSMFSPMGAQFVAYPDLIAASFALMAAVFLVGLSTMNEQTRTRSIFLSILMLVLAMHFRAPYETLAIAWLVVSGLAFLLLRLQSFRFRFPNPSNIWIDQVRALVTVPAVALVLSIPWRAIAAVFTRPGDFRWSTALDLSGVFRWVPTESLYKAGIGFVAEGGGNFGCVNDPVRCSEIGLNHDYLSGKYTNEQYLGFLWESFLEYPSNYVFERTSTLLRGFLSETGSYVGNLTSMEGFILLGGGAVALVLAIRRRFFSDAGLMALAFSAVFLSAILVVFHMETRYFLPSKMMILAFGFMVLSLTLRPSQTKGSSRWV